MKRDGKLDIDEKDVDYKKRLLSENIKLPDNKTYKKSKLNVSEKDKLHRIEEELYRACLAEGMSETQVCKVLNVDPNALKFIEKRLLANDGQTFLSKSTAHRYYEYVLKQEQCIRDLEYFINMIQSELDIWNEKYISGAKGKNIDFIKKMSKPSVQGAIMAIKAKSDIHDKVLKTGQDMGIIEKRAKEIRVSGNINLAALPTDKLKNMLGKKLKEFDELVSDGKLPDTYKKMLKNSNNSVDDYVEE